MSPTDEEIHEAAREYSSYEESDFSSITMDKFVSFKKGARWALDREAAEVEALVKVLELAEEPLQWFSADYPNDGEQTKLAYEAYVCIKEKLHAYRERRKSR